MSIKNTATTAEVTTGNEPPATATAPTSGQPTATVNDSGVAADIARLEGAAALEPKDPAAQALQQQQADAAEAIRMQTVGVFRGCLSPTFKIVAPNWGVQDAEVVLLSEAYTDCLLHYYPEGFAAIGPALGAFMATIAVFGPRLHTPLKAAPAPAEGDTVKQEAAA